MMAFLARPAVAAVILASAAVLEPRLAHPGDAKTAEVTQRAKAQFDVKDYAGAVETLFDRLRRGPGDGALHDLLGNALLKLERADEAANQFEVAVRAHSAAGQADLARPAVASLRRVDPISQRREAFLAKAVDVLTDAAQVLQSGGHGERALEILERVAVIAKDKDSERVTALIKTVRAAFEEVSLDAAADEKDKRGKSDSGPLPLFEHESRHYKFACHLEPSIVKHLGDVMDDIHAFYVLVYFDGDEKRAKSAKPTVRVHPTKAAMLATWQGAGAPLGWWSPGTNEVITFDSRSEDRAAFGGKSQSLDDMLITLFHEASHQFMTLLEQGGSTPAWINEGTASFFEGTVAMADGRVLWPEAAEARLGSLCFQLTNTGGPSAADVVSYNQPASYPAEYYSFGWGLAYFLQQYEDEGTFEYVYRPLYAEYRSQIIKKGAEPMKLFCEVFLGKRSPLGHATFEDFSRDWQKWILETVRPLHGSDAKARALRTQRVQKYLAAAEGLGKAKTKKKTGVTEEELLVRALSDVEYIRSKVDKEDNPDVLLIVQQADLLERLKRPAGAAPLLEKALDLVDAGRAKLDPKRYEELAARLAKFDAKNAALRTARSKMAELARTASTILADYGKSKTSFVLRGYTFAAAVGAVLRDDKELLPAADALREKARAAGLLLGSIHDLAFREVDGTTIFTTPPKSLASTAERTDIECVRSYGIVDPSIVVSGEYAVRARLSRAAEADIGSALGVIVSGKIGNDWTIVGLDERGQVGIWTAVVSKNSGVVLKRSQTLYFENPIDPNIPHELSVHVLLDGSMEIVVDALEKLVARLPVDGSIARNIGLFAKNCHAVFENVLVELYP